MCDASGAEDRHLHEECAARSFGALNGVSFGNPRPKANLRARRPLAVSAEARNAGLKTTSVSRVSPNRGGLACAHWATLMA